MEATRQRDPDATRARLLAAARREFSDKGIAGARVDAIAAAAGVNKRMLYHYYGSKEGLFREILRARMAQHAGLGPGQEKASAGQRLAEAYDDLTANADYVRLLMWEALEAGTEGTVAEEDIRRTRYAEMVQRVREDQQAGKVDSELDPAQVLLSRIALAMFPIAFPQVARMVTGEPVTGPKFGRARRAHLERGLV